MDPNQQPTQSNAPPPDFSPDPLGGYGTVPQSSGSAPSSPLAPVSKKNRLPFIAAGAVVGLLLIVSLIVVLTSKDKPSSTPKSTANTSNTDGSAFLRPATAIGVEQTTNSISQDLSGLNDDSDFPKGKLDDKALGL